MRYVDGSDLQPTARGWTHCPPERAIAIVSHGAGAVDAAHERGSFHRDVKPSNVLLDRRGHVHPRRLRPIEAAARAWGDGRRGAPKGHDRLRRPGAGPAGRKRTAAPTLYSLGCLLRERATGKPPFAPSTDSGCAFRPPGGGAAGGPVARRRDSHRAGEGAGRTASSRDVSSSRPTPRALGIAEPRRNLWPDRSRCDGPGLRCGSAIPSALRVAATSSRPDW